MPLTHDDFYAQSWYANFGPHPFVNNPSEYSQNIEDTEYVPIELPENKHPPSLDNSKTSGGSAVELTTDPEEKLMKLPSKPMMMNQIPKKP